jgi:ABC-type glycerol-3-phosphate transport system substrate-binding protein
MFDSFAASKVSRRRFLTSSAASVGALAGAGALLDACSTSTNTTTPGTTTLTVMYAASELTPAYIKQFEQLHPSIKINFIEFDQTRLNAMFAAGTPPDFVRGTAVGSVSNSARGVALSLDPYLAKSSVLKTSDLLGINDSWRWDGKKVGQGSYYGITKDWSQDQTIWYNQALLERAGISPLSPTEPITYDQLFTMATKLTTRQGGKTLVYGYGTQWSFGLTVIAAMMIKQQGGDIYNAAGTQADFTTPAAQKAIEWFINYEQAKIGPSSLDPAPDGWDGPVRGDSQNHLMLGHIEEWFYSGLAGIRVDFTANPPLTIKPTFVGDLRWVQAIQEVSGGRIAVAWERETAERFRLSVTIPPNMPAQLVLPAEHVASVTEEGNALPLCIEGNVLVCVLKSGTSLFTGAITTVDQEHWGPRD